MFASRHTAKFSLDRLTGPRVDHPLLMRLRLGLIARAQRRQLARLDARGLADIGVSPRQAQAEVKRPAWDVPATWLR